VYFLGDFKMNKDQRINDEELLHIQKMEIMGQFAGGIAHDFNNILSIVEGYIHMAQKRKKEGKPYNELLDKMLDATLRGGGITRQLLAFSHQGLASEEIVDVGHFLEGQKVFLAPLIGEDIKFSVYTPKEPAHIECAPEHLTQIMMNLASNSRDAMQGEGVFHISVFLSEVQEIPLWLKRKYDHKKYICIAVTDNGGGIPEAVQSKIFEPFFTTKPPSKGTGLGLATVFGLVEQMSGGIDVVSDPGKGTCFYVYLPQTDKMPVPQNIVMVDRAMLEGKTILIAEDEIDLRYVLNEMFVGFDMNVLTAADGNEALAIQDEYEGGIDFLLTDIVMPEMSGIRLAELFGTLRPKTHVLFMSGYPAMGEAKTMNLPDGALLLSKPLRQDALKHALCDFLSDIKQAPLKQAQV